MDSEWVEIRVGNPTEKNAREYIAKLEEDNKRLREELETVRNTLTSCVPIKVHY